MKRLGSWISSCVWLGMWGCTTSGSLAPPNVPDAIAAPAGAHVAGRFHVVAVETFACEQSGGAYAWTSVALDAKIEDWSSGAVIGMHTHTPAPTFTANDGSSVIAMPSASVPSPTGTGGPWLLLAAAATSGAGMFSDVTYLQRINTAGGGMPAATCDATTDPAAQLTVDGSADFYFYTH